MAGCRIVNAGVVSAVDAIRTSSTNYKTAGEEFINALNSAISEMEGEAKDAIKKFIDTDVSKFVSEDLPSALDSMATLLDANREQFESTDMNIAESIKG